ncbi:MULTISPECIES: hypothetical protein [Kamptonema]|uniref:hypothetical protein n=1 Tax=Kamptonema TaxID=1501433 RepID=UPI0001DAD4A2|nr:MULTISPECIES: hypothetical protein [Kamptonema]CBN56530.1 hypothetical protein OSCI_3060010 [Kamptonema sp. PCC 6506]
MSTSRTLGARGFVKDLLAISNWVLLIRLPAARKLLGAIDTRDVLVRCLPPLLTKAYAKKLPLSQIFNIFILSQLLTFGKIPNMFDYRY